MQGRDKQAYDRGTNIFSPDGRLYQVEYAREAVQRGSASVGVRTPEGVVLVAQRLVNSNLIEQDSIEKLHKVDNHIGVASAGHVADARQLIQAARKQAQVNRIRYGESISIDAMTKTITDHVQEFTQMGGARPFGVSLLFGGVDEDGTTRLYEADPSGTPYEWQATAIGGNREEIQAHLEEAYEEGLSLEEGILLALDAVSQGEELNPEEVGAAVIPTDTKRYNVLDVDEVADHLSELDLLAEGDYE